MIIRSTSAAVSFTIGPRARVKRIRFYERGTGGGFRLGARHGMFCLGCCWALILVMFSVGVASLAWMAVLTALMVYEKTRPSGARSVPVTGIALLGAAAVLLPYSAYAA